MILNPNLLLKPLLMFADSTLYKKVGVNHLAPFVPSLLKPINIASSTRYMALRKFSKNISKVWVFTKTQNPNKLYVDNNSGIFLSAGIILKFMNLDQSRFLKKRLRTWYGFIKALKLLQRRPFVIKFSDLNGKKSVFLSKLKSADIKISWLFISLFQNKTNLTVKKSRRIKRWIKKKYYQIGVGEGR